MPQKIRVDVEEVGLFVLSGGLLDGAITATDTTIVVDDDAYLLDGDILKIDDELIGITLIVGPGNTCQVERARDGSVAAAHVDNSIVRRRPFFTMKIGTTAVPFPSELLDAIDEASTTSVHCTLETRDVRQRVGGGVPTKKIGHLLSKNQRFRVVGARDIETIRFISTGSKTASLTMTLMKDG